MNNLDQQLKAALKDQPLDQPGIVEMALSNFRGRQRVESIASAFISIVFLVLMIWCAVRFFATTETREMIMLATVFLFLNSAIMMMKFWFWLMMIRYSLARELKRMELQLHSFGQK